MKTTAITHYAFLAALLFTLPAVTQAQTALTTLDSDMTGPRTKVLVLAFGRLFV